MAGLWSVIRAGISQTARSAPRADSIKVLFLLERICDMPNKPPKPCKYCSTLLYNGEECQYHPRVKRIDSRPGASARGYGWEWVKKVRDPFILLHPWCADPFNIHHENPVRAQMVDHIIPKPKGSDDPSNLQALCYHCHRIKSFQDGTSRGVRGR